MEGNAYFMVKPVIAYTLCSYGLMNVINYRLGSRGKMGGENLYFT
jgi:hypothetical protein